MPFISKDWRSPGEEWVKTQEGWEKKKVLECTSHRYDIPNFNTDDTQSKSWSNEEEEKKSNNSVARVPPHCHITIKCTREIAGFNGLSEAVRRLDFTSAVRDGRRFSYICALLDLLVGGQRLTRLPGAAQKVLISMLEEVANHVATSQQNLNALRELARGVSREQEAALGACWGRPLGSRALWGQHRAALDRITHLATDIHIQEPGPEVTPKLHDLPEECIREILLRIADHRDLESASSSWSVMQSVCEEQRVWRRLVAFHFTPVHIEAAVKSLPQADEGDDKKKDVDWKAVFHKLRKQHGLREDGAVSEALCLCPHCRCLYWRQLGHPCIADQCPEYRARLLSAGGPLPPRPVPPRDFLHFFSL